MIRLFLNGIAASAGGGLTYLRNVVPILSARSDVETSVALSAALREEFAHLSRISFVALNTSGSVVNRFWQEQTALPKLLRSTQSEVLISAGNFAVRKSPIPQILLSRNSLYTSKDFYRDLRLRGEYRMWLDTRLRGILAKRSLYWADCIVAPSKAFADELQRWTGVQVIPIHHGFDRDRFFSDDSALSQELQEKLKASEGSLRLLFVSHYNYYRNFETLIRALPTLKRAVAPRPVRLILTCKFSQTKGYRADLATALAIQLGLEKEVIQLGAVPYQALHHLYRACDIYVTPAYAETFAHPLVEAMASGLPVVASDLRVHREICEDSALYFPCFSHQDLAKRVLEVVRSPDILKALAEKARARSKNFSWERHVDRITGVAATLSGKCIANSRVRVQI
jgi:glycosyltransferase involved in cell wall biosynthesis